MTRSLRARLLAGLVLLVTLGLVVSSAATYLALQTFLDQRLRDQLTGDRSVALQALGAVGDFGRGAGAVATAGMVELARPERLQGAGAVGGELVLQALVEEGPERRVGRRRKNQDAGGDQEDEAGEQPPPQRAGHARGGRRT